MSHVTQAVFLSYASQDAEAARRIADALREAGVEVWFDQSELVGGDSWDAKIRAQIGSCALFIPIVSAGTQTRDEGYFRLEWKLAVDRSYLMAHDRPFLLPVVIDATPEAAARVPVEFRAVQWTRLPGGDTPAAFCARLRKLLRGDSERETGRARPFQRDEGVASPSSRAPVRRWRVAGMLGLALMVALGIWRPWKTAAPATVAAPIPPARQLMLQARALIDDDPMMVRENYRLADELCQRAELLDAADAEIWATSARVSGELIRRKLDNTLQRRETARSKSERALRLAPLSIEAGFAMATWLGLNKETAEAERHLRELLNRAPTDRRLLRELGQLCHQNKRNDEALAFFRRADALPGGDPQALAWQVTVLTRMGRYIEAEVLLDQLFAGPPVAMAYHRRLLLLGFYWSDLPAARAFMAQIPARLLQEDVFTSLVAEMWLRLGDGDRALEALQKNPRDFLEEGFEVRPKGYVTGHALRQGGRETAAQAEWRQALAVVEKRLVLEPNTLFLLHWRGVLQALIGQKTEARETRKLLLELNPRYDAWFDAALLVALGELDQAIARLEKDWPAASFTRRSDIRGDLIFAPWFAGIRDDPRVQRMVAEHTATLENLRYGKKAGDAGAKGVSPLPAANPP